MLSYYWSQNDNSKETIKIRQAVSLRDKNLLNTAEYLLDHSCDIPLQRDAEITEQTQE